MTIQLMVIDKTEMKHNSIVEKLFYNPSIIGIERENIQTKVTEYEIYVGRNIYVKPDIKCLMLDGTHYFIEVKSTASQQARSKGKNQMSRVENYSYRNNISAIGLLVYPKRNYKHVRDILENLIIDERFRNIYK